MSQERGKRKKAVWSKKKLYKREDSIIILQAKNLLVKRADIEIYLENEGYGQGRKKVNIK